MFFRKPKDQPAPSPNRSPLAIDSVLPYAQLAQNISASGLLTLYAPYFAKVDEQEKPLLEQETCVAALVGWRRWKVRMFQDVLLSTNQTVWAPHKRLEAKCLPPGAVLGNLVETTQCRECRGVFCSCGIYCYKTQSDLENGENSPTRDTHLWGEVYIWGRVVEHEKGYRAQYAYPKSLVNTGGIAAKLASVYQCQLLPAPEEHPMERKRKEIDAMQTGVPYVRGDDGVISPLFG